MSKQTHTVKISKQWQDKLSNLPETGMGYQHIDIKLKDGRTLTGVIVTNGDTCISTESFNSEDIRSVEKTARDYGDPLTELSEGDSANFVLQHHKDRKRRDAHYDLRLGTKENKGLFSWAVPSAKLPEQGNRKAVFQTPIHPHSYADVQGRVGSSDVRIERKGKALINKVTPNTFSFTLDGAAIPVRYSLVKLPPRGNKKTWLLVHNKNSPDTNEVGGRVIRGIDDNDAVAQAEKVQKDIESKTMKVADIIKRAQSMSQPAIPKVTGVPTEYYNSFADRIKKVENFKVPNLSMHAVAGRPTIGYGFDLHSPGNREVFTRLLPDLNWDNVYSGKVSINDDQANKLLKYKMDEIYNTMEQRIPGIRKMPEFVQSALLDIGYTGPSAKGHIGPKTVKALNSNNFIEAGKELLRNKQYETAKEKGLSGLIPRFDRVSNALMVHGRRLAEARKQMASAAPQTMLKQNSVKDSAMVKTVETNTIPLTVISPDGKDKHKITAEIADNEPARKKGLSKRAELPKDHGMLFSKSGAFWMKDCLIPLDIAFLAKDGTIVDKQAMDLSDAPDYCKPIYISKDPSAVYALEMPKGWFDANNIAIKDKIVCRN